MAETWWENDAPAPDSGQWWENDLPYEEPKTNTSLLSDLGSGLKYGVQKLPSIATGAADLVTTVLGAPIKQGLNAAGVEVADRPFDTLANMAGEATGFTPGKWADQIHTQLTPETRAQIAENKQAWDDPNTSFLDAAGTTIANPRAALYGVAQSAAPMLAGGFVGRGAGILGGIASDTARAAIGEGAVMAGQAMDNIDKNVSPELAAAAALPIGVAGGLIGARSGALANRLGVANADALFTGGAGSAARGAERPFLQRLPIAVGSEAAEEALQSVPETGFANVAEGKPFTEGMGQSAFEGALAGGIMGAGMSPFNRGGADTPPGGTPPPGGETPPTPPDQPPLIGSNPDAGAMVVFRDGTTAYRSDFENALAAMPGNERAATMARVMGFAPQPASQDESTQQPLQADAAPTQEQASTPTKSEAMGLVPTEAPSITNAAITAVDTGAHDIEQANAAQEQAATLEQASQSTKVETPKVDQKNIAIEIAKSLREQIAADTQEGVIRHPQEQERSMLLGLLDVQDGGNLSNQELESRLSAKQRKDFEWLQGFAGIERIAAMRSAQQQPSESDAGALPVAAQVEQTSQDEALQSPIEEQSALPPSVTQTPDQATQPQPEVVPTTYDSLPIEQRAEVLKQAGLVADTGDLNIIGKAMLNRPLEQMRPDVRQAVEQIITPPTQDNVETTQAIAPEAQQPTKQPDAQPAESLSVPDRLRAQREQLSASAMPTINLPKDERQRQQALKQDLRDRLGLTPSKTQAGPKRSPFKEFIVSHGISDSPADVVGEGNAFRANNILPRAFRKNGLSLDALAERAVEAGYITRDDLDAGNAHTVLASMIQDEVAGRKTHLPMNMQTDDASAKMEAYRRAEVEGTADKYGLPYDQYTSTNRLASMVRRIQTRLEQPENTGLLKPDRILRNAQEAVARIERKRTQEFERDTEFAQWQIADQDASLSVLSDDDGNPMFVRQTDIDAARAWGELQKEQNGQTNTVGASAVGQDQAPVAGVQNQSIGSSEQGSTAAQPGSAQVQDGTGQSQQEQAFGLTSPTRSDVLTQQAAIEAEAARKDQGGDKPITRKVTADQVDLFNPQGGLFDAPADDPALPPTNLKEGLDRIRESKQATPSTSQAGAATESVVPAQPLSVPRKLREKAAQAQQDRADYFTPGNIISAGYGPGHDRVISYTPPNEKGEGGSVTVQAVVKENGQWVTDQQSPRPRTHSTMPNARELAQGPVERAKVEDAPTESQDTPAVQYLSVPEKMRAKWEGDLAEKNAPPAGLPESESANNAVSASPTPPYAGGTSTVPNQSAGIKPTNLKEGLGKIQSEKIKQKIRSLFKVAMSRNDGNKAFEDLSVVTPEVSKIVKDKAGIDVSGYVHSIDESSIRHIIKNHGDEKAESERGQIAITEDDIANIQDVVSQPDSVEPGEKTSDKKDTLIFKKKMGDVLVYVQEVRDGRKKLSAKTLWKVRDVPPATAYTGEAHTSETSARNNSTGASTIAHPSAQSKPENTTNTENAGEELRANRRGKRTTGLQWSDIADKDAALRVSETVKAKVYPKPDYQAISDSAPHPLVAYVVKLAYDAIAPKPNTRVSPTDAQLRQYIEGVNRYMAGVLAWAGNEAQTKQWLIKQGTSAAAYLGAGKGMPTAIGALANSNSEKSLLDTVYQDGWKNHQEEVILIGANKVLGALQPGLDEARKGIKEIDKGWPGKLEAWQKQGYRIIKGDDLKPGYYENTTKGNEQVSAYVQMPLGGRNVYVSQKSFRGLTSRDDPQVQAWVQEQMTKFQGQFLVLDKNNRNVASAPTQDEATDKARELTKRASGPDRVDEKGISVDQARRTGIERRMPGEDISAEKLKETFGFRGVNFGNWMLGDSNAKERQLHLNHAYDAFMDLADVLEIPPRAISMNGMLGFAVGAQGSGGRAAAHFVPGHNEINLTREAGAGALAHEWGHALDHYFAKLAGLDRETEAFLTEHAGSPAKMQRMEKNADGKYVNVISNRFGPELRPEILERFKAIVNAMEKRQMTQAEATAQKAAYAATRASNLDSWLKSVRMDFEGIRPKVVTDAMNAKTLAEFDKLADKIKALEVGDGKIAVSSATYISPVVDELRSLYKKAAGRQYPIDQIKGLQASIDAAVYSSKSKDEASDHVPQMTSTKYAIEAHKLDKDEDRKPAYWRTKLEMFARAFDAYVSDKLAEKAANNTYLHGLNKDSRIVPTGEERKAINAQFDALVQTIETKETDGGNVAMFSRSDTQPPAINSLPTPKVQGIVNTIKSAWKNAPDVVVVSGLEDAIVPQSVRNDAANSQDAGAVEGFYHDGKVYLVANQLASAKDVARVLLHEAIGHYGLRGVFGDALTKVLNQITLFKRQAVQAKIKEYGLDANNPKHVLQAAEEVLAEMAQTNPQIGFVRTAIAAIRTWLREHGFGSIAMSDDEIVRNIIAPARGFVERGQAAGAQAVPTAFSRSTGFDKGQLFRAPEVRNADGKLLAPNGKPSKLTEGQWHQVRSPQFKQWFGDWQAMHDLNIVYSGMNKNDAESALSTLHGKDLLNLDSGIIAKVNSKQVGKLISNAAVDKSMSNGFTREQHYAVAANIEALWRHALLIDTRKDKGGDANIASIKRFAVPVVMDGKTHFATMLAKESIEHGHRVYTVEMHELKTLRGMLDALAADASTGIERAPTRSVDAIIEQLQAMVNPANVSKVIDENGEPRLVYHTSSSDITTFVESEDGELGAGIYLTADKNYSNMIAGLRNVPATYPVFVSIRNPLKVRGSARRALNVATSSEIRKKSEKLRHDGIVHTLAGDTVARQILAFNPAQIKSAIGNVGAYGQRPITANEAAPMGMTAAQANKVQKAGDIRFSRTKIVGQTTRQHTPEQMATFGHVGRQIEVPTLKERAQAMTKDLGKKLAQGIADQFAPVKEISKDAYALLRLSKGASGALETFLNGGKLKLTNGVYDFDETQKGGVIDKLLKPLQGEHHDFLWWVAANRAETLMAEDRENLFTPDDIAALKTLTNGNTTFDYTIQNGVRRGQVTRNRAEIYKDSQATLQAFNKNALDMAEQSGLIDPESRRVWESEFYVPFYRVADTTEGGIMGMNVKSGVVRQQAFKHLKGGKQALNSDLLDNVLMNWAHLLDASAKNRAAKATIEAAENMGLAAGGDQNTLKQIASSIGNRNGVVWFMDEGVKRYSLIDDPYLMTALTSLEYAGMRSPVMNAMSAFKRVLTIGVTASPFFKIRNLIRDSVQVIGTGNISYNPVKNVTEGWKLTNPKNDEYFRLLASGGTIHFGTMLEGSEAKRVQALVESGVDAGTILNDEHKVKAFYRKYIEPGITAYNELGNRGESVNRAALYNQLIKQGVSHADAALQARDLMDFSMQGSFTTIRFLTQVVPFMNARIQGLYKLGRAAKEDPARFSAVIGATALLSLVLLAAYSDDDDWKRRTDADRNNYWWFKFGGTAFRIPKPFEIGAIATLAERSFELAFEKEMTNERFRNQVMALLGDNLSMNPIPQIVKPVLDVYANVNSFTGTPIESMGMERLKSEYRFNDKTSMAARGISTAANAAAGLIGKDAPSPVKIDHLLQGYFGWLGTFVVQAGDLVARGASNQPTQASRDYMKTLTGGIASDLRDAPSRYVGQVYEQAKAIEQAYNTWRMLQKQGKVQEAQEFRAANHDKLNRYRSVEHVKKAETSLNNRIRMIERSTSMDADQKREMIRRLNQNKERVAKMVA